MAIVATLGVDRLGRPVQAFPPGPTQTVAYTGTAAATTNPVGSTFVRVVCTTAAFVSFGTNPTATLADLYVPANLPEWFPVDASYKVSILRASADGTAYITAGG
jgi:hypothetical protein